MKTLNLGDQAIPGVPVPRLNITLDSAITGPVGITKGMVVYFKNVGNRRKKLPIPLNLRYLHKTANTHQILKVGLVLFLLGLCVLFLTSLDCQPAQEINVLMCYYQRRKLKLTKSFNSGQLYQFHTVLFVCFFYVFFICLFLRSFSDVARLSTCTGNKRSDVLLPATETQTNEIIQ